ncbi:MAG TPA: ribonuclease HII [Acidimicrobiales bacterium]|nr:ribonuclease HII [Acidimicrobiales bacterium]
MPTRSAPARPRMRRALQGKAPSLAVERELWADGHEVVVGLDEVGRGAWAGPLTVAAAVLPPDRRVNGVRDSKALTAVERERLYDRVAGWCAAWGVGHASAAECDALGMSEAQRLAARRALAGLGVEVGAALIDGKWDFVGAATTRMIVKGDARCLSIAAASVLAKVTRDRMMRELAGDHPGFEFAANKGYPCPRHKLALRGHGPTAVHRMSWAFVDDLPWSTAARDRVVAREAAREEARLQAQRLQGRLFA